MARIVFLLSFVALVVAAPAMAKGPSKAVVTGPGLDDGVVLRSDQAMRVMELSGFWPATYTQSPSPLLARKPAGELGPRYAIEYELPRIIDKFVVRQDVYPFAPSGPVTHVGAGQMLFDRPTTGGWFRASGSLRDELVALGVPRPRQQTESRTAWAIAPVVVLLLGVSLVAIRRRR